jgi:hypothetical protein
MHPVLLSVLVLATLSACQGKQEEEVDYDQIVQAEEDSEWQSQKRRGNFGPEPQEVVR